jgi:hypothetical protein
VHHEAKALSDAFSKILRIQILAAGVGRLDEAHHFGRNLVRSARSTLGGEQPRQTAAIEIVLHLAEVRARHAKQVVVTNWPSIRMRRSISYRT